MSMTTLGNACGGVRIIIIKRSIDFHLIQKNTLGGNVLKNIPLHKIISQVGSCNIQFHTTVDIIYATRLINTIGYRPSHGFPIIQSDTPQAPSPFPADPFILTPIGTDYPIHVERVAGNGYIKNSAGFGCHGHLNLLRIQRDKSHCCPKENKVFHWE